MNEVTLVGTIAQDPELQYTPNGTAVCTLRLSVGDASRPKVEGRHPSCFLDAKVWKQTAEYAGSYLAKGDVIAVHGKLAVDDWTNREGQKRRTYYVDVAYIQCLSPPRSAPPQTAVVNTEHQAEEECTDANEDPFAEN